MTKVCLYSLLLLNFFEVQAQFSLGADLVGMGLTRSPQNEIELKPDSSLSTTRLVFSVNSNLTGAFKSKQWEFSLGLGHKNYFWKQKFEAPTSDVYGFIPLHEQMGSTKGLFGNLSLRFFFKSKSSAEGLI